MAQMPGATTHRLSATLEPLLNDTGGEALRQAWDRLRSMGFRFVQLSATKPGLRPRDLDRSARRDLLATMRRRELDVSGLDFWIPPQHFLDPAQVDRAVTAMQAAIELAADLGRCPVSFALPESPSASEQTVDPLRTVVDAIADHAHRFGVALADHSAPIAKREGGRIGVGIDPAAWLSRAGDPAAAVLSCAGTLISARVCDLLTSGMRGPIGNRQEGQLDVTAYRVALSVTGYERPVIIDARQWVDPWPGLEQTKGAWLER